VDNIANRGSPFHSRKEFKQIKLVFHTLTFKQKGFRDTWDGSWNTVRSGPAGRCGPQVDVRRFPGGFIGRPGGGSCYCCCCSLCWNSELVAIGRHSLPGWVFSVLTGRHALVYNLHIPVEAEIVPVMVCLPPCYLFNDAFSITCYTESDNYAFGRK